MSFTNDQVEAERLKNLMTSAATDLAISESHDAEYTQLRKSLLSNAKTKALLPKSVLTCTTLKEFKREMQSISGTYQGRRTYIREAFSPLLVSFFSEGSMTDAIADIVQQVDYGELNLLPQDIQDKGREMSEVYLYLYCIENSLRIFIAEIMSRDNVVIPTKVKETIARLKNNEAESKYLPVRGDNDLFYCDFIQLAYIMVANWGVFGQYFPEKMNTG